MVSDSLRKYLKNGKNNFFRSIRFGRIRIVF